MSNLLTPPNARKRALGALVLSAFYVVLNLAPAFDAMVYRPLLQDTPVLVAGVLLSAVSALALGFYWASKPGRPLWLLLLPVSVFAAFVAAQHMLNQPESFPSLTPDQASQVHVYQLKTMATLGSFAGTWASILVAIAAIHVAVANARKGTAIRYAIGIPIVLLLSGTAPSFLISVPVPVGPLLLQSSVLIALGGMAAIGLGLDGDKELRASHAKHYALLGVLTVLSITPLVIAAYSTSLLGAAGALASVGLLPLERGEIWSATFAEADSVLKVHALSAALVALWAIVIPLALREKLLLKPTLFRLSIGLLLVVGISIWLKTSMSEIAVLLIGG